jgi:hypothetical protein
MKTGIRRGLRTALAGSLLFGGTLVASVIAGSVPASAGVTTNLNRCESINGVVIYQYGTAHCESGPSATTQPNIATAMGNNAQAVAGVETNIGDSNDHATAVGDNTSVSAYGGVNEVATGIGNSNFVQVAGGGGSNIGGTATAIGTGNYVLAYYEDNDTATAVGTNNTAETTLANNATATALGTGSQAYASYVDSSRALAVGGCTIYSESGTSMSCHA